jgi:hypothetical protein
MSTGEGAGPRAWGVRSRVVFTGRGLFRQSGEVVENARNELLAARILSVGGEELDQIAHLLGQFGPVRCRCCEKEFFELRLTRFQGLLIELNLLQAPSNFRGFLGGHAAVFIKLDGIICHGSLY